VFTLTGADGAPYPSAEPGLLGGHRRRHGYGRLDCPAALRWIARGHYVRERVFFADEATAVAAGYRPCAACLPERYAQWKRGEWPPAGRRSWRLDPAPGSLEFLRARAVPGVESIEGDVYRRTVSLPHGPALVEIDLGGDGTRVRLAAVDSRDHEAAIDRCRALLGLDVEWHEARAALAGDPVLAPLIAARPALRVPGTVDGAELAVRAVVNQQVSLAAARTVLGRLALEHGKATRHLPLMPFPPPARLAAADPETLPMPRSRARALVAVCGAIADGRIDLLPGADPAEARAALRAIPGIGDWTASYIAMRALRDPDAFLPTDLGIRRALESLGQPADRRSAERLAERWRPWRTYAAQLLWAHAAESSASRATSSAQPQESVKPLPP
jgi:AraC family transcriptional regulator of adaptative response / DNA-3-methyladenine glycosylase II